MSNAKIEDLPVNPEQKTSPMIIKNLVDVVNKEFDRRQTLYDTESEMQKEEILNQYKKAVGFDDMKKQHDKAKAIVEQAQNKINLSKQCDAWGGSRSRAP